MIKIRVGHGDKFADTYIRIIQHMSDIARYMRYIFRIGMSYTSAWPSLIKT